MGIGVILHQAIGALLRRRSTVFGLAIAWVALDGLLLGYLKLADRSFGLNWFDWYWHVHEVAWFGYPGLEMLEMAPPALLRAAFRSVFAILLLRTLLVPRTATGRRGAYWLVGPVLLILLFEVLWTALLHPLGHLLAEAASHLDYPIVLLSLPPFSPLARAPLFVAYSLALSRLCFIYPNAMLGQGLQLRSSWRQTKALSARLFTLFVVIPMPLVAMNSLAWFVILRPMTNETFPYLAVTLEVVGSIAFVVESVLTLAVIAVAYVTATGLSTDTIPSSKRTPEQLARAFD